MSAGSIEYWPDPQRGIAEAYRVLRPGGVGVVIGPVRPAGRIARALADLWMLFPEEERVPRVVRARRASTDVALHPVAPDWYRDRRVPYAVAVAGTKPHRRAVAAGARRRPPRSCGAPLTRAAACAWRRASPPARSPASRSCRSRC